MYVVGVDVCMYAPYTNPITDTHLLGLLSKYNISGIQYHIKISCG